MAVSELDEYRNNQFNYLFENLQIKDKLKNMDMRTSLIK